MITSPPSFSLSDLSITTLQLRRKGLRIRTRMVTLRASSTFSRTFDEQRIYVLGVGNLGKLLAHSLARKKRPPPITLLLHRQSLLRDWEEAGQSIELISGGTSNKQHLFDLEILAEDSNGIAPSSVDPIGNVIVATKAPRTTEALARIKHRLNERSTILFTQNGMGISEEVSERLFPNLSTRPSYLVSVVSHGLYSTSTFSTIHAGLGSILIGGPSTSESSHVDDRDQMPPTSGYLLRQILEAPVLSGQNISTAELLQAQFEKLIINAVINPLTVVFDCLNGQLSEQPKFEQWMRLLLYEAAIIVRSLPEVRDDSDSRKRFWPARLEEMVLHVASMTAENQSSMLQDIRARKETEINYINGYLVARGEQLGLNCDHHRELFNMITEKHRVR